MNLSVVVPVFNAAPSLGALLTQLQPVLQQIARDYEVVLVDDGSCDESWQTICQLAQTSQQVRGIRLKENYGQHNALLCGLQAARYEVVITLDADLQNPPSQIPKLIDALADDVDVVYGYPANSQHPWNRKLASRVIRWVLSRAFAVRTANVMSPFRALRTRLRDKFADHRARCVFLDALLCQATPRFAAVPVVHCRQEHGSSRYTFNRLVKIAFDLLTSFTTVPFRLARWTRAIAVVAKGTAVFYVFFSYFLQRQCPPQMPSLVWLIVLFTGIELLAAGVIRQYTSRLNSNSMPPYVVDNETSSNIGPAVSNNQTTAHATDSSLRFAATYS